MALEDIGGIELEYRDYDKEPTSTTFFVQNIAAADWETEQPKLAAIRTALSALLDGAINRTEYKPLITNNRPAVRSLNAASMREKKWRLIFRDNDTLDEVTMRIGTADPTATDALIVGSKKANMSSALWTALQTACEDAGVINPDTGNTMYLVDAELFGWDD